MIDGKLLSAGCWSGPQLGEDLLVRSRILLSRHTESRVEQECNSCYFLLVELDTFKVCVLAEQSYLPQPLINLPMLFADIEKKMVKQ